MCINPRFETALWTLTIEAPNELVGEAVRSIFVEWIMENRYCDGLDVTISQEKKIEDIFFFEIEFCADYPWGKYCLGDKFEGLFPDKRTINAILLSMNCDIVSSNYRNC